MSREYKYNFSCTDNNLHAEPPDGFLPVDAGSRKALPLFSGLIGYFPAALVAVAQLSRIGNDQHNPGQPLQWARDKSGDELDALARHLFEAGALDIDGVRHSTKLAWRALANLQKELERDEGAPWPRNATGFDSV